MSTTIMATIVVTSSCLIFEADI